MKSSPREPLTFPTLAAWSRGQDPGIMEGWLGWAWVWLRLVRAGLVPVSPRRNQFLYRALEHRLDELEDHPRNEVSAVRGVGAYAVVIAIATTLEDEFAKLLPRMFSSWERSCESSTNTDVYSGTGGVLLAAAEIEECLPGRVPRSLVELAHQRLIDAVRADLLPSARRPALGFAHGFAGHLLALEMARSVFRLRTPKNVLHRALEFLEDTRREAPDGAAFWPYTQEDGLVLHAWCNGSPGIALALMGCHRFGTPHLRSRYRDLALRALRATTYRMRSAESFCCGTIGRVQVLIEAYRQLGERKWMSEASAIARTLRLNHVEGRNFRNGTLGTIYLRWRLAHPAALPFPAFGSAAPLNGI